MSSIFQEIIHPVKYNGLEEDLVDRINFDLVRTLEENRQRLIVKLDSGKYTPVLRGGVNISASTINQAYWTRIGNIVSVAGSVVITATAASEVDFLLTLPLPATFSSSYEIVGNICGVHTTDGTAFSGGVIYQANNKAFFVFSPATTDDITYGYEYKYTIKT